MSLILILKYLFAIVWGLICANVCCRSPINHPVQGLIVVFMTVTSLLGALFILGFLG